MRTPELSPTFFVAFLIVFTLASPASSQTAVPMLVNYQGELRSPSTGEPVPDGSYDMVFWIYDAEFAGTAMWKGTHSDLNGNPVQVTGGIFSVILGSEAGNALTSSIFTGADRWLEIQVGAETLSPRQRITSVAYSLVSEDSRLLSGKEASQFANSTHVHSGSEITSGVVLEGWIDSAIARDVETSAAIASHAAIAAAHHTKTTSFTELTDVAADAQIPKSIARDSEIMPAVLGNDGTGSTLDADYLDGNDSRAFASSGHTHDSRYWRVTGNTGTDPATDYLGTADDQAVELRVNNTRALRLEPNATSPNIIGGLSANSVASGVYGATISGGGQAGFANLVTDQYGTVGGGYNNQAGDNAGTAIDKGQATVGGGYGNKATGLSSTVAGGWQNEANGRESTVGGGSSNVANGTYSTVSGGTLSDATGNFSTVGGGYGNKATANYATIAGGGRTVSGDSSTANRVTDNYGTVGGGGNNQAGDNAGTTDDAYYATVGGGRSNEAGGQYATVGGGWSNGAADFYATVGGGYSNNASANSATISGGYNSSATADCATVGGGYSNNATSDSATIAGGRDNAASGSYATVGGGYSNQASSDYATIAGGGRSDPASSATANRVKDRYGTIGGGGNNQAGDDDPSTNNAEYATVGGGKSNEAGNRYATVGGGISNIASGAYSTVAGGVGNDATGNYSFVGGGDSNEATKLDTTVGGGYGNEATGEYSTIAGGWMNQASGQYATIPGGAYNGALGGYSFAAGRHAKANGDGCFVWGDSSTTADIAASGTNEFKVRASGGVWFYSTSDLTKGVKLEAGGTGWVGFNTSNKALKYGIRSVDGKDILYRLAQMPISRWSYQSEEPKIEHLGPMAQDFYDAFGLGEDNKHISTVDADGVAMAAIQGLHEIVQEKEGRIFKLEQRNADLEERLEALEALVVKLTNGKDNHKNAE